ARPLVGGGIRAASRGGIRGGDARRPRCLPPLRRRRPSRMVVPARRGQAIIRGVSAQRDKVEAFRQLHQEGCFVMPNPWDIGSAVLLEHMGFKALATTSAGFAWSVARPDQGVGRDEMVEHLLEIASAVDVPVNADFEGAYADD